MGEINGKENFIRLVNQYKNLIFSVCLKLTGDYFTSEDITQETFLAAYLQSQRNAEEIYKKGGFALMTGKKYLSEEELGKLILNVEEEKLINAPPDLLGNILVSIDGLQEKKSPESLCNEMVHGGIVFIDEFDSNLHDVYLCALLEYLMEYGEGQLCFTTHNVGPMDILKQHKKSIDFLSEDHTIYPWTKSGNYSPSKLYRNGMIEGSPFNVDSIDFIGAFGSGKEDE